MTVNPSGKYTLVDEENLSSDSLGLEQYIRAALHTLPNASSYSARTVLAKPKKQHLCHKVNGHEVSDSALVERLIWIDQVIGNKEDDSSSSSPSTQKIAVFALTSYEGLIELEAKSSEGKENGARLVTVIDKVDSTGYKVNKGGSASVAKAVIRGYLSYRQQAFPQSDHLIYVFARAQPQYLFRNSASNSKKYVLSDSQLIKWWKSVLTYNLFTRKDITDLTLIRSWFVPGLDLNEARVLDSTPNSGWIWGTAYPDNAPAREVILNLPDDAKSRLLKESDGAHSSLPVKHFLEVLSHGEECGAGKRAGIFYIQKLGNLFLPTNPEFEDLFESSLVDASPEASSQYDVSAGSVLSKANEDVSQSLASDEIDSEAESEASLSKEVEIPASSNASDTDEKIDEDSINVDSFDSILQYLMEDADFSAYTTSLSSTTAVNELFDKFLISQWTAHPNSRLNVVNIPASSSQTKSAATVNLLVPKRKKISEDSNPQDQTPTINILTPKRKKVE